MTQLGKYTQSTLEEAREIASLSHIENLTLTQKEEAVEYIASLISVPIEGNA